jgi:Bacterial protein of unknown function (DUF899)
MRAAASDTESPGLSAFYKDDDGEIFHTYSSYGRGPEELIGTLMILDRAPKGRNEKTTMDFVRRHDEYPEQSTAAARRAEPTRSDASSSRAARAPSAPDAPSAP